MSRSLTPKQTEKREMVVMDALQLEGIKSQINGLLEKDPKKIESFKMKMLTMSMNQMLIDCTPESIINCGLQALTLDLPLQAGQGYIVKYAGVATLDIGYKGWQLLAKRSGYSVLADPVYQCDEFTPVGFGFNAEMNFTPNHGARSTADDDWVKKNLDGVIVSIQQDDTMRVVTKFVPADMILKIMGKSPSIKSTHSPYNNWAEQMMNAKAIKQVISKSPIDLSKATALSNAIDLVNETESNYQKEQKNASAVEEYPQERFDDNWPKWVSIIKAGDRTAAQIIMLLTKTFRLSNTQMEQLTGLASEEPKKPIEGEVVQAEEASYVDTSNEETVVTTEAEKADDSEPAKEPTEYDETTFKTLYKGWHNLVEAGSLKPQSILSDKAHKLTETQIKSVKALVDAMPVEK